MPVIRFTRNIQRHVTCPVRESEGRTVREALEAYFRLHAQARGYVFDDRGRLRPHMAVFVDGVHVLDRDGLSDPVAPHSVLDVIQALSGG